MPATNSPKSTISTFSNSACAAAAAKLSSNSDELETARFLKMRTNTKTSPHCVQSIGKGVRFDISPTPTATHDNNNNTDDEKYNASDSATSKGNGGKRRGGGAAPFSVADRKFSDAVNRLAQIKKPTPSRVEANARRAESIRVAKIEKLQSSHACWKGKVEAHRQSLSAEAGRASAAIAEHNKAVSERRGKIIEDRVSTVASREKSRSDKVRKARGDGNI